MTRTTQTTSPTGPGPGPGTDPAVPPAVVPAAPRDRASAPARRRHRGDAHP
ncbi:hypothetical protein [Streptomyces sp. PBH53]|uniref:hypothetical protein n=1 Tax=Streptomyces sp. PBH53 TaxID=1577075 RepID=UPI000ACF6B97|nr:hypothetical protein [Streptomyces sp. PBH53]